MFVIAAAGNLSVIITLFRSKRHRRSRISLMICHLAVADLIVAFFMIPLEVSFKKLYVCILNLNQYVSCNIRVSRPFRGN